jgi:hypothetical protein
MESRLKKQEEKDRRRELTSTRDLFLTCSLCAKHLIFETKDYCTDCYQRYLFSLCYLLLLSEVSIIMLSLLSLLEVSIVLLLLFVL